LIFAIVFLASACGFEPISVRDSVVPDVALELSHLPAPPEKATGPKNKSHASSRNALRVSSRKFHSNLRNPQFFNLLSPFDLCARTSDNCMEGMRHG
ncbi:hypothetical protein JYT90_01140, partial [bacterium AH-315-P07]|nr:hypothetical protein [bacterium AH-315-P07]